MYGANFCFVKDKNNYTFNTNDILVEQKQGAKRKLIDYHKSCSDTL